jgi:hypothetical protein
VLLGHRLITASTVAAQRPVVPRGPNQENVAHWTATAPSSYVRLPRCSPMNRFSALKPDFASFDARNLTGVSLPARGRHVSSDAGSCDTYQKRTILHPRHAAPLRMPALRGKPILRPDWRCCKRKHALVPRKVCSTYRPDRLMGRTESASRQSRPKAALPYGRQASRKPQGHRGGVTRWCIDSTSIRWEIVFPVW